MIKRYLYIYSTEHFHSIFTLYNFELTSANGLGKVSVIM